MIATRGYGEPDEGVSAMAYTPGEPLPPSRTVWKAADRDHPRVHHGR